MFQKSLQFEIVRKMKSVFSNVWYSSSLTLTTSVLARDIEKTYVTSCPTNTLWFEQLMSGMHKRMGDMVKQDKTITLNVIHRLVEDLEAEYILADMDTERKEIADISVFILAALLGALRGEEVVKMVVVETREYFALSINNVKYKDEFLPLRGRLKGENGEGYHIVAVSAEIDSGLKIGPWIDRGLVLKERRGITQVYYFCRENNRRLKLPELERRIMDRVAGVQDKYSSLKFVY